MPYVYVIRHRVTNNFYIGYRSANVLPAEQDIMRVYFTSSKKVNLLGIENFDVERIIHCSSKEEALDTEQKLIKENFSDTLILNKSCRFGTSFGKLSEEATLKISEKSKMNWKDPAYREKVLLSRLMSPKNTSEAFKKRAAKAVENMKTKGTFEITKQVRETGRKKRLAELNDEEYLRAFDHFRKPKSEDHKMKISKANTGKQKTAEHRIKLSISAKNRKMKKYKWFNFDGKSFRCYEGELVNPIWNTGKIKRLNSQ